MRTKKKKVELRFEPLYRAEDYDEEWRLIEPHADRMNMIPLCNSVSWWNRYSSRRMSGPQLMRVADEI
jgi:hypothetical protein